MTDGLLHARLVATLSVACEGSVVQNHDVSTAHAAATTGLAGQITCNTMLRQTDSAGRIGSILVTILTLLMPQLAAAYVTAYRSYIYTGDDHENS